MEDEIGKVQVSVTERSIYGSLIDDSKYAEDTIDEVVAWLLNQKAQVPAEYQGRAKVRFGCVGYDSDTPTVEIFYERPQSEHEIERQREYAYQSAICDLERGERMVREAQAELERMKVR